MSSKETAMQELLDTLENDWLSPQPYIDLVKSKLEKEKQQIIDAYRFPNTLVDMSSEQYYNETFKKK
jgi:hypothetical protein